MSRSSGQFHQWSRASWPRMSGGLYQGAAAARVRSRAVMGAARRALAALAALAVLALARGEALDALERLLPDSLLANLEDLLKAASDACDMLPLDAMSSARFAAEAPLHVLEVTRASRRALPLARAHLALSPSPASPAPLTIYIPGWWNTPTDEAAQALTAALLQELPSVLVLDTRPAFRRGYLSAAARVEAVARPLAAFVRRLAERGRPPADVHLIGFSLGAHAAGLAGRLVRGATGARLGRITALDPAKPCFGASARRLRRSDAAFVHVLHSSAGVLGLAEPLGHADVYVNGVARGQPECAHRRVRFECEHNAAWRAYAGSVRAALAARRCAGWRELAAARCAPPAAPLGHGCSARMRGLFLHTADDDRPPNRSEPAGWL